MKVTGCWRTKQRKTRVIIPVMPRLECTSPVSPRHTPLPFPHFSLSLHFSLSSSSSSFPSSFPISVLLHSSASSFSITQLLIHFSTSLPSLFVPILLGEISPLSLFLSLQPGLFTGLSWSCFPSSLSLPSFSQSFPPNPKIRRKKRHVSLKMDQFRLVTPSLSQWS